ncbi:TrkH family potassium uptake protein, partial [Candidatus Margulisiibacteriota bacterium]
RIIVYNLGKVLIAFGLLMFFPIIIAVLKHEIVELHNFSIGFLITMIAGNVLLFIGHQRKGHHLTWGNGLMVVAFSWIFVTLCGAIPYYLSNHFMSFIDACFDVMSGITTTGMILIRDLDHVSFSLNMWRHLLTYIGGQGIIIIVLTFFVKGTGSMTKIYAGEGKEEKIFPNVIRTARLIWGVSLMYLVVGWIIMFTVLLIEGFKFESALFQGLWLFMTSWSTGGFAPFSQNILYYHSVLIESATLFLFFLGSMNFALHYAILSGKWDEIKKNMEIHVFTASVIIFTSILCFILARSGIYTTFFVLLRKGVYHLVSGHTGTGLGTLYTHQFIRWGPAPMLIMTIIMILGGSACSTAGGLKSLRIGIVLKAIALDIKRLLLPESAVFVQQYHHIRDYILSHEQLRSAMIIIFSYISLFTVGVIITVLSGYDVVRALFENASIVGNVGLSCGIIDPGMPALMKWYFIFAMWAARLEFIAVFGIIGYFFSFRMKR